MDQGPSYETLSKRVTELEKELSAVRESEKLYRSVVDNAEDAIAMMDIDSGQLTYTNRSAQKIADFSPEELSNFKKCNILNEREFSISRTRLDRLLEGETVEPQEYTVSAKDGRKISVESKSFIIDTGVYKLAVIINRDISHRKAADKQRKESDYLYKQIMDHAVDPIFLNDVETARIIDANKSAQDMVGKTIDELKQMTIYDIVSPGDHDTVKQRLQRLSKEKTLEPHEYTFSKNGDKIYVEASPSIFEFKGRKTIISIHRNITDRKLTEQRLKESETKYRSLIETMNDGFSITEKDGRIAYANEKFCKMLGYRPKEIIGKATRFFVSGKNRRILEKHIVKRRKGITTPYELELTTKDGKRVPVLNSPQTILDSEGNFQGTFGVHTDLSELKKAEAAIRKSEEAWRALLNATTETALLVDPQGTILAINEVGAARLGGTVDEITGMTLEQYLPADIARKRRRLLKQLYRSAKPLQFQDKREGRIQDISLYPIHNENHEIEAFAIFARDITNQVQAENRLKESIKEKNILIQEVHHRVKNNMQIIIGLLQLQALRSEDEVVTEMFEEARNRINTMALIHEKLYQAEDFSYLSVRAYIKDLGKSLFRAYNIDPNQITFQTDITVTKLHLDHAIPFGMVLNEIISNALKYAFPNGLKGCISISLNPLTKKSQELVVYDNGVGMPKQFKKKSRGTLGLTLIKTLVERQLKGRVDIENNGGTQYRIRWQAT